MTTILSLDARALLAAIRTQPDEDTPRLVYADYLEENGESARAEAIRVQCELAKDRSGDWQSMYNAGTLPDEHPVAIRFRGRGLSKEMIANLTAYNAELDRLRSRESALLTTNADRWRKGPVCEWCEGEPGFYFNGDPRGVACLQCWGSGDAGGLMNRSGLDGSLLSPVEYVRGMKRVHCRAEEVWRWKADHDNGNGDGAWLPTKWALAVCRHHPDAVELWVTDREPYHFVPPMFPESHMLHGLYRWARRSAFGPHAEAASLIPDPVFELLPRTHNYDDLRVSRFYRTADAARVTLARTAAAWVRSFEGGAA